MEAITITLNGREVSGQSGMSILDLARESGVEIPTLCHDPLLEPIGACRICIVEDERSGALMASCVTPIAPGMVINTQSPRVQERRKTIIKLMLASHPDSCLVCDKGNRCQLRKIAADMGVGLVDFQRIPQLATVQEVNPFIERDLSKCILCAKCIRACQELVGQGAIDYFGRGFVSKPATLGDLPLEKSECTFCGTCVALCPTGAIMEKEKSYRGTSMTSVRTVCPYCGYGCGICLEIKDNHLVRVRPDKDNPLNRSLLCVRGSYGCDFVHSLERLTRPLVKVNGNFQEVSWDEALAVVAEEFKRIKEAYGSNSIAVFGSSKCTNEENYLLQKFARCVLGTNNIDNGSRLYSSGSRVGLCETIGIYANIAPLENLERSEVILVIGADPSSSLPPVEYAIKRAVRRRGTKLLVIDPRGTKLTSWAHLWLKPKTGADVAFLNSMAKVIIDEGLFDKEYVENRTDNFGAFVTALQQYAPESVEGVTGISAQEIRQAARLFGTASRASIVYGSGITQHINGASGVAALLNLAMLAGVVVNGGGIYEIRWENNGQGACDMGALPDFLPGYQSIKDAQARERFGTCWGCELPVDAGLTALEMIIGIREGKIKGMYIVGEDPAVSFPDLTLVKQALGSLEFLVVQDMFLTETAKLAKVVLPAASFAEKEGTVTSFDGAVQRLRKALEAPGDSLPDWEIVRRLSQRMGYTMLYSSPQEVMAEIAELAPSYQEVRYGDLERKGYCFRKLEFSNKLGHFSQAEYVPPDKGLANGYPYTLLTGTVLYQFGSGSRSLRSTRLKKFLPEAFVEISEIDAKSLKVEKGDIVRIVSPIGALTAMVKITETLDTGMVFMPVSFPESPVNGLFEIVLDPVTKSPAVKACRVKLEKVGKHG